VHSAASFYEQRINRSLQKSLGMLQSLQATRKEQRRHEIAEATKLLQLSEKKGLPYEPAKDGFVFSNDEIHTAVDRERRLDQASNTDFHRHRSRKHNPQAA
jgi:hypothetical protein